MDKKICLVAVLIALATRVFRSHQPDILPPQSPDDKLEYTHKATGPNDKLEYTHKATGSKLTSYKIQYNRFGRIPVAPSRNSISLDFEMEMGTVVMTPDILLLRSGIDLGTNHGSCSRSRPLFPNVSRSALWSVGVDGFIDFASHHWFQQLQAELEATTKPMRPTQILKSDLLEEVSGFINGISSYQHHKSKSLVPGSSDLFLRKAYHMKGTCDTCRMHYTVGLKLAMVPRLLGLASNSRYRHDHKRYAHIIEQVDELCESRDHSHGCHDDYKALLVLSALVLRQGRWRAKQTCRPPKFQMVPWLVRTHFGDLARYVADEHGEETLATFPEDVLSVTQLKANAVAYNNPYKEYMQFNQFAELMVPPPTAMGTVYESIRKGQIAEMVKTPEGLCTLSKAMMKPKTYKKIDQRLKEKKCTFTGMAAGTARTMQMNISALEWLKEMRNGRDLLSDSDSPISAKVSSHLVFKSMGSWRMSHKTRGIVYMECRLPYRCLDDTPSAQGTVDMMRKTAEVFERMEHEWQSLPLRQSHHRHAMVVAKPHGENGMVVAQPHGENATVDSETHHGHLKGVSNSLAVPYFGSLAGPVLKAAAITVLLATLFCAQQFTGGQKDA